MDAHINAVSGYYGTPLQAAAASGDYKTCQLLVVAGADVNVAGGYYGTALQAAARDGSYKTC